MVHIDNKVAIKCPEAIRSARIPFVVAQSRSSAPAAMSANAGRTAIPDSDSDGEPYYYSDIDGKPYYYSDILSQGSGLQRASLPTNRWEN